MVAETAKRHHSLVDSVTSAAAVGLLDCLAKHLVAPVAWDDRVDHSDQADLDPSVDPTCVRPAESETGIIG